MSKDSCKSVVVYSLPLTLILFFLSTCLGQVMAGGVLLIAFWLALALRTTSPPHKEAKWAKNTSRLKHPTTSAVSQKTNRMPLALAEIGLPVAFLYY